VNIFDHVTSVRHWRELLVVVSKNRRGQFIIVCHDGYPRAALAAANASRSLRRRHCL